MLHCRLTHALGSTGGGTGRCLQTTEAGGMGEGWSDAFAEYVNGPIALITYSDRVYYLDGLSRSPETLPTM